MSVANFALMLKYIDGLKGNARSLTVTKAEELLTAADSSDEEEKKDDSKKQSEGKCPMLELFASDFGLKLHYNKLVNTFCGHIFATYQHILFGPASP